MAKSKVRASTARPGTESRSKVKRAKPVVHQTTLRSKQAAVLAGGVRALARATSYGRPVAADDRAQSSGRGVWHARPRHAQASGRRCPAQRPKRAQPQDRNGAGPRLSGPAPHRHGRIPRLCLGGTSLFQPVGDRAGDYRHCLERPTLLRAEILRCTRRRAGPPRSPASQTISTIHGGEQHSPP